MLFRDVKCINVDEVSRLLSDLLRQVDLHLTEIRASKMTEQFGGFDLVFCEDLRQLLPLRASEVYKRLRNGGSIYSDGKELNGDDLRVLADRFVTREQAAIQCPVAVRLFFSNNDIDVYNGMVAESCEYKHDSVAIHVATGHRSRQEEREALVKIQDLSRAESGNLPSVVTFCTKWPYMLLKNIDVTDDLVNGMVGTLMEVELNIDNTPDRVWLQCPSDVGTLTKAKVSCRSGVRRCAQWVPIEPITM
ncbi:hypothetical protein MRX96_036922 [Rhipicephalus microplus]